MATDETRKPILEMSRGPNVKFLGYNLLRDIQFAGQPVVPRLLGESQDELLGPVYEVENLPGRDLDELIKDPSIRYQDKLAVLRHVTGQLEAIDQAGFIPFDRSGANIRVLSFGGEGVSTRQLDIEDFYDQAEDYLYSQENAGMSQEALDLLKKKGVNFWARNITMLAELAQKAANMVDDLAGSNDFSVLRWPSGNPKGSTLRELLNTIDSRLNNLQP